MITGFNIEQDSKKKRLLYEKSREKNDMYLVLKWDEINKNLTIVNK